MQRRAGRDRGPVGRALRLLVVAAAWFATALPLAAHAAGPSIDTVVVRLRADAPSGGAATLANADRDALQGALQSPFSIVGHTRGGGYILQLSTPLAIDAARAAVNRARLLPQVLYANVADPGGNPPDPAGARAAAKMQPPIARMIVKFRDGATGAASARNEPLGRGNLDRLAALAGQPVAHQRDVSGGAYLVGLFQALPMDQAASLARSLESDPTIEYAVPDLLKQPLLVPNDPRYASQWHYMSPPGEMGGVNLPPAWDLTTGAASVVVAVIDTGSLASHPDLAGRYVGGYDFINDSRVANDGDGRDVNAADPGDWITSTESASGFFAGCGARNSSFHGTHVAGTIGAATNNGAGVAGINWVSKILPVRVLGKCGGYTSDIVDAIRWAAGISVPGVPANPNPARVMNLSFGGYACDSSGLNCGCDAAEQSAIDDAVAVGSVIVVAAGNSNAPAVQSAPGNCNGVITVAATGRQGQRASYSNYGALVEVSAPGGSDGQSVLSTLNSGTTSPDPAGYNYASYQGTSMATPHVAGIASLMLSRNPSLTPSQVASKIQTTARAFPIGTVRDCTAALCGAGIVDAAAAVLASSGTVQPAATSTTLSSSGSPAVYGTSVTFTATVAGTNPTGNVSFTENGISLTGCGNVALTSSGGGSTASCVVNGLAIGVHSITANYAGDAANLASTSAPLAQVVNAVPAVSSNVALVANGGVATASSTLAGRSPSVTIDNERAGINYASAGYGGIWKDATRDVFPDWLQINFNGSKTIDRVVVYTAQTNYTAPVEPTDTLTTTLGLRDFNVQGWTGSTWVTLAAVTGNNLVKRTLTFTAYATDRIRIVITNAPSESRIAEVEAWTAAAQSAPVVTTTALSTSGSPALAGTTVTFTASVTGSAASGTVGFTADGTPLGNCGAVTLTVGNPSTATCSTSNLAVGNHTIGASYGGDASNAASTSAPLTQNITAPAPGPTTTALLTSGSPAVAGATVTFTARVTGSAASGTVAFSADASPLANCSAVALTVGNPSTATCSTSSLTVGNHTIGANYAGDAANLASTSVPLSQVINAVPAVSSNVALAANGGVATASSTLAGRSPSVTIDNERAGINYASAGYGGIWKDATRDVFPDWLQINFNGSKTIDRVVVYTAQTNYTAPVEPTDTLTTTLGLRDFNVQGWTGSTWVTLAAVTGNNLVKRTLTFTAYATDRIRIVITNAPSESRIAEVEAWTAAGP